MGESYNHIVAKKLAEKAGFKDARDYLSKHVADLSQSALTIYGAVAAEFSEPGPTVIEVPDDKGRDLR